MQFAHAIWRQCAVGAAGKIERAIGRIVYGIGLATGIDFVPLGSELCAPRLCQS